MWIINVLEENRTEKEVFKAVIEKNWRRMMRRKKRRGERG